MHALQLISRGKVSELQKLFNPCQEGSRRVIQPKKEQDRLKILQGQRLQEVREIRLDYKVKEEESSQEGWSKIQPKFYSNSGNRSTCVN
jgi:hypothetical protein